MLCLALGSYKPRGQGKYPRGTSRTETNRGLTPALEMYRLLDQEHQTTFLDGGGLARRNISGDRECPPEQITQTLPSASWLGTCLIKFLLGFMNFYQLFCWGGSDGGGFCEHSNITTSFSIMFLFTLIFRLLCNYIIPLPLSFSSLQRTPPNILPCSLSNSCPFSISYFTCMYVFTYLVLKITPSGSIMLLFCVFSGPTI